MTNLLVHNYYYRGKSQRKVVKDLVESNDILNAKTKLEEAITEHDNYITNNNITGNNFTIDDNLSLHHAKDHLDSLNSTGQLHQKNATISALDE